MLHSSKDLIVKKVKLVGRTAVEKDHAELQHIAGTVFFVFLFFYFFFLPGRGYVRNSEGMLRVLIRCRKMLFNDFSLVSSKYEIKGLSA